MPASGLPASPSFLGTAWKLSSSPVPALWSRSSRGDTDSAETYSLVKQHVSPLIEKGADTLVLGCTHYPFLLDVIKEVAGPGVTVLDASLPVARQVQRRLQQEGLLSRRQSPGSERFWTSGEPNLVEPVISKLWGKKVHVEALPAPYAVPRDVKAS